MSNDELERRIEILEKNVEVLTEALRSTLEWKASPSAVRASAYKDLSIRFEGREQTQEILDRLA